MMKMCRYIMGVFDGDCYKVVMSVAIDAHVISQLGLLARGELNGRIVSSRKFLG